MVASSDCSSDLCCYLEFFFLKSQSGFRSGVSPVPGIQWGMHISAWTSNYTSLSIEQVALPQSHNSAKTKAWRFVRNLLHTPEIIVFGIPLGQAMMPGNVGFAFPSAPALNNAQRCATTYTVIWKTTFNNSKVSRTAFSLCSAQFWRPVVTIDAVKTGDGKPRSVLWGLWEWTITARVYFIANLSASFHYVRHELQSRYYAVPVFARCLCRRLPFCSMSVD